MGTSLDASTLRDAMTLYLEALREHRHEIDSLNVFPVPDGDTGTNMLMTQEAVEAAVRELEGAGMAEIGEAIGRAALMGARGNSGVILSQILRGLCGRLCRDERAGGRDLAEALERAEGEARAVVAQPVEGTILTVLRDAAAAARGAARDGAGADQVADSALAAARTSLAGTRDALAPLAEAGVVDAGGKGLVLLLDAMLAALRGTPMSEEVGPAGPVGASGGREGSAASRYGFEVMYLVESADDAVAGLRTRLGALGDSLVVVGGGGLYNVHVHTDRPGAAVEEALEAGRPRDIRIVSLDEQVAGACLAGQARGVRVGQEQQVTAAVAVCPGHGIGELFRSLGARVVAGGTGRSPSAGDLVSAVESAPSEQVVLIPNHRDVIPTAERAAGSTAKRVHVARTASVPEGIAAAAAFNPDTDLQANVQEIEAALARVSAAEVAEAVRDGDTPAGRVRAGEYMGVAGGEVRAVGPDPVEVALRVTGPLVLPEHEVLTLLVGRGVRPEEADRVTSALGDAFPEVEVEVHEGGQPIFPFLIGLE
jgi:uncharacterized protein